MSRLKWDFKRYVKFLNDYGFKYGHTEGSHYYYNGRILGENRVVEVVFSKREKYGQSPKTIKFGIKHSGIPKRYFEEWDKTGKVYSGIIY